MKQLVILPDSELINLFFSGNEEAFSALIEKHRYYLLKAILSSCHNCDQVKLSEIQQITYIKALTALRENRYLEESNFAAWISRIAINVCIDLNRQEKRSKVIYKPEETFFGLPGPESLNSEESMVMKELHTYLKQCIEELEPCHREVVLLRMHGFKFIQIAKMQEKTINTVQGIMRYARKNIAKKLLSEYSEYIPQYLRKTVAA